MAVSELDLQLEFYINGVAILVIASLGILGNILSLLLFTFRYFPFLWQICLPPESVTTEYNESSPSRTHAIEYNLSTNRGSHGLSVRRARRTKPRMPKGSPARSRGSEGHKTSNLYYNILGGDKKDFSFTLIMKWNIPRRRLKMNPTFTGLLIWLAILDSLFLVKENHQNHFSW